MAEEETWLLLRELGFQDDATVTSDAPGGLSYRVGAMKLEASVCTNPSGAPVILIGGVHATKRSIAEVHIELPRRVESAEFLEALLADSLDRQVGREWATDVDWIARGRRNRDLLPWEISRVAYQLRPACVVESEWWRPVLQRLHELRSDLDGAALLYFGFDGSVLRIDTPHAVLAVTGKGHQWPHRVVIEAGELRHLPQRLRGPLVRMSFHDGTLQIGNRGLRGREEST